MWNYEGDPSATPVDEVHFLCGDTDSANPLLQNEEIELLLAIFPKKEGQPAYLAAAQGCEAIAAKFGRMIDRTIGSIQRTASQQYDHYKDLAQTYRIAYATKGEGIVEGGSPLSVRAGVSLGTPLLGGGGPTYLGTTDLSAGGGGDE